MSFPKLAGLLLPLLVAGPTMAQVAPNPPDLPPGEARIGTSYTLSEVVPAGVDAGGFLAIQAKLHDRLYGMVAGECTLVMASIAKQCRVVSSNVTTTTVPAVPPGGETRLSATVFVSLRVTLKD